MRKWWVQFSIAAALLVLLLWRARVWDLGDAFRDFDIATGALVVLLNVPAIAILSIRSRLVLRRLGYDVSAIALLPLSALSNVAAIVTPGASGDLIRTPFLRDHHSVSYRDSLALIFYERGYSFFVLTLGTGFMALWTIAPLWLRIAIVCSAPVALALPVVAARPLVWFGDRAAKGELGPLNRFPRLSAFLGGSGGDWLRSLSTIMSGAWLSVAFAAQTVAIFAIVTLQLWLVAGSFGVSLSPGEATLAMGAATVAGIASLLPLGLGTLDLTMSYLLEQAGATVAAATTTVLVLRATMTLPAGLLGLLAYFYLIAKSRTAAAKSSPGGMASEGSPLGLPSPDE